MSRFLKKVCQMRFKLHVKIHNLSPLLPRKNVILNVYHPCKRIKKNFFSLKTYIFAGFFSISMFIKCKLLGNATANVACSQNSRYVGQFFKNDFPLWHVIKSKNIKNLSNTQRAPLWLFRAENLPKFTQIIYYFWIVYGWTFLVKLSVTVLGFASIRSFIRTSFWYNFSLWESKNRDEVVNFRLKYRKKFLGRRWENGKVCNGKILFT